MIDFPIATLIGEQFVAAGITWIWNGQGWIMSPSAGAGPSGDAYTKAESDSKYVDIAGDTMTGSLTISGSTGSSGFALNRSSIAPSANTISGSADGTNEWQIHLGDSENAVVGGLGKFSIHTIAGGAETHRPLVIEHANGNMHFGGVLNVSTELTGGGNETFQLGRLTYNTVNFGAGYNIWGSWAAKQIQIIFEGGYWAMFNGASGGAFNINVNAYKPGGGTWIDPSDARIKNVQGDFTKGLAAVTGLHPVTYTFKANDTERELGTVNKTSEASTLPYPESSHYHAAKAATAFIGLIAQEAETVFPEMVKQRAGYIDGQYVTDLRDLDTTPLIYALINAVKELKARVETLEGAAATTEKRK